MEKQDVIEKLESYSRLVTRIKMLQNRLDLYDERSRAAPTAHLDGMPHGPGKSDRTADYAQKVLDVMNELYPAQDEAEKTRESVERFIDRIPQSKPPDIKAAFVLRSRFIELMNWGEITYVIYGPDSDGTEFESRLRQVYRWRDRGIQHLCKLKGES